MSSKEKARRATTAADSALTAAKEAATLSKSLPDKHARKLAPLIKDAKKAGSVTKKQLEDKPRRIERTATDAIVALAEATAKIEQRLAKKADAKKADAKKTDAKKTDAKKQARKRKSAPVPAVPVLEPTAAPADDRTPVSGAGTPAESTPGEAVDTSTSTILQSMTVAALRARAKAEGRAGYSRLSKAELIALFV
ncbi:MAG: hypothetical protein LBE05_03035 [Microbacterium sp.]|jgi:DNA-binding HxlR family transcriptional regulator|nr:hypothetical protein [Microbacterium sp.]